MIERSNVVWQLQKLIINSAQQQNIFFCKVVTNNDELIVSFWQPKKKIFNHFHGTFFYTNIISHNEGFVCLQIKRYSPIKNNFCDNFI